MEEMEKNNNTKEVDVVKLFMTVLKERKLLAKFMICAAVVGAVVAFSTPKTYTSHAVLAPEMNAGGSGLASSLADMASSFGVDIGSNTSVDAIYPELYPNVFTSTDFIMDLFDVPVRLHDDNVARTYVEHLKHDCKTPFWMYPKQWISQTIKRLKSSSNNNNGVGAVDSFKITETDDALVKGISSSILCSIDKKTNIIDISVTDQDPLVAAILADTLQHRLQEYITEYRTKKARADYDYCSVMLEKLSREYDAATERYTRYSDSHNSTVLSSISTQQEQYEREMEMAYEGYSSMKKMRAQAEARIQERVPAFIVIQRPIMPYEASSTPRIFVVAIFAFMGFMLCALWVLYGRDFIKKKQRK